MQTLKIGIFGSGTVGGGVIEILEQQRELLKKQNLDIRVSKICVRDLKKSRDFKYDPATKFVTNFDDILEDPEIDLVIELIGGTGLAKDIIFKAIQNKKHVVTANKAVIAKYLNEIEELLAQNPAVHLGYEASVGGGIPIIHTLQKETAVDNISRISGIMNGTTNYMLSKMESEGASYDDVLKEAQDLGFAEADPTADVGGFDARAKISILSKIAFGLNINEEDIETKGIQDITDNDFAYAKLLNGTIKLLGVVEKTPENYSIYVSPVIVPFNQNLAKINGATNAVAIKSEFLQETVLIGQGAGRFPTANAVVSDVYAIANNTISKAFTKKEVCPKNDNITGKFYIRINIQDGIGIIKKIGEICENNQVSIDSILQLPIKNPENLPFVVTTDVTDLKSVQKVCSEISQENFCQSDPLYLPIL